MKLTVHHTINCTPAAFWALYLDPDFVTRMHLEGLGATSAEVLDQVGAAGGAVQRRVRYGQRPDMPGPIRKIFGEEVVTTEDGAFDPSTGVWTYSLVPGTMADKTTLGGSMRAHEAADGTTDLEFTLEAKVKIMGIGGVVEKFIERQARDSQDKTAAYVNAHLAG